MDLIVKQNRRPIPLEIKSSCTFHTDFPRPVRHFRKLSGVVSPAYVVCGGDEDYEAEGTKVVSFRPIKRTEW